MTTRNRVTKSQIVEPRTRRAVRESLQLAEAFNTIPQYVSYVATGKIHRDGGGGALINKARGRTSSNQLIVGVREYVVELIRTRYVDFGPTLAAEVLLEKDGVKVSRETLRKWIIEDGLWLSRRQRRSFHQPRLRRESYGELVQIDGSDHRWFEQRGPAALCTATVAIWSR